MNFQLFNGVQTLLELYLVLFLFKVSFIACMYGEYALRELTAM